MGCRSPLVTKNPSLTGPVDVIRRAASCGRETPIEVVSRIGFGVDTRRPRAASPALRLGS